MHLVLELGLGTSSVLQWYLLLGNLHRALANATLPVLPCRHFSKLQEGDFGSASTGGTEDKFGEACVNFNQRRRVPNATRMAVGAAASGWLGEPPSFPPAAVRRCPGSWPWAGEIKAAASRVALLLGQSGRESPFPAWVLI